VSSARSQYLNLAVLTHDIDCQTHSSDRASAGVQPSISCRELWCALSALANKGIHLSSMQAWDIEQNLGDRVSSHDPKLGPSIKDRFNMASRITQQVGGSRAYNTGSVCADLHSHKLHVDTPLLRACCRLCKYLS
jgi:hypothetical protein